MKRTVIAMLLAAAAVFAAACGGSATNSNNSNTNKPVNMTPPNINSTPAVVTNNNVAGPGVANGAKAPDANTNKIGAQTKGVEEKMKIMRESGNTKPSAPRDVVAPPPPTPKKP